MKQYIMPQTQAQIISVSQLMAGSGGTPRIGINDDPISGEEGNISFGN